MQRKTLPQKILSAASFIFICLALLTGCGSSATNDSQALQNTMVTRGTISSEITATGNLAMPNQAKLTFGSPGTVDQILVKLGDSVTTGQLMAKLDSVTVSTLKQNLLKAQISVKQAQMDLDNASTPTLSSGGSSVTAPDPLDIESKDLALKSAILGLDNAQKQLDGSIISAPFDGQVAAINILTGDRVSTDTVAIRLIDPSQLEVETLVNEMDIFNINQGSQADIQITATGTNLSATVASISPSAAVSGGVVNYTVQLKVKTPGVINYSFPDAGTANIDASDPFILKEGLSVSISLVIERKENTLLVLSRALSKQGQDTVAQVLNSNGVIEQRIVQTGLSDWQNTEIVSGLSEGEVLLISTMQSNSTTTTTSNNQMGPPPGDMGGSGPPPP